MSIDTFLIIIWLHFLADFILQSNWMSQNKSFNLLALGSHILVYSSILTIAFGWKYGIINGILHFIVDFFTSRKTKKLWAEKRVHAFFVVIGLDQALHLSCLLITARVLLWDRLIF